MREKGFEMKTSCGFLTLPASKNPYQVLKLLPKSFLNLYAGERIRTFVGTKPTDCSNVLEFGPTSWSVPFDRSGTPA